MNFTSVVREARAVVVPGGTMQPAGLSLRFQVAGYFLLVAGEVASSPGDPPPLQEGFEVQLLPFSKTHYRPKKAIFIKSKAIISGFMMITSLLKKTTSF